MKLYNFITLSICILSTMPAYSKIETKVSTSYNSSLQKDKVERSETTGFGLILTSSLNNRNSLTISSEAEKDLKGEREFKISDVVIGHSFRLNKELKQTNFSFSESVTLPMSSNSKDNTEMYTKLGMGPSLSTDLSKYIRGISLVYGISGSVLFHKYETAVIKGASNTHYILGNKFIVIYQFTDKFALGFDNRYSRSYTYQNNTKDTFIFDQSLSYGVTKNITSSIGHNNQGSALGINGTDNNIEFYNERTSTVYFALEMAF